MTPVVMDQAAAAALRAPFPPEHVGRLPRIWCKACRDSSRKVCAEHTKARCRDCGNNITTAHLHLDYVGHAEATDRLLQVDPAWTWEPVAFGPDGLPVVDRHGGLWIRLTIAGVTRLGYGHAEGKPGPDAVKEAIGDAIRNAAMRFGVALDLWGAKFKDTTDTDADEPQEQPEVAVSERARVLFAAVVNAPTLVALKAQYDQIGPALAAGEITQREADQLADHIRNRKAELETAANEAAPVMVTDVQHRRMHALWRDAGYKDDRDVRLARTAEILGLDTPLATSRDLTHAQADQLIAALEAEKKELRKGIAS